MYCKFCGVQLEEKSNFCHSCGKNQKMDQNGNHLTVPSKNKRIGLLWLILPPGGLIMILAAYAIATYVINVMSQAQAYSSNYGETTIAIMNIILGFLGIICVVGVLVGIPIGIYFLNKKGNFDPRSGENDNSEFPSELEGWSWGAAGLSWIWGVSNSVWLSLLSFIPILNWFWWIVLGIKGREWAWKNQKWESVNKFKEVQRKWDTWGLIIFSFYVVIIVISIFSD